MLTVIQGPSYMYLHRRIAMVVLKFTVSNFQGLDNNIEVCLWILGWNNRCLLYIPSGFSTSKNGGYPERKVSGSRRGLLWFKRFYCTTW